jgi:RNA polymerase sigma factor for flagellar operon FliA
MGNTERVEGLPVKLPAAPTHQLVIDHLPMVKSMALRIFSTFGSTGRIELSDLIQAGTVGLAAAARSYDPSLGVSFAFYARFRVRGEMQDTLRQLDITFRQTPDRGRAEHFFDQPLDEDLGGTLRCSSEFQPDTLCYSAQRKGVLAAVLNGLPEKLRNVIFLHYSSNVDMKDISAMMNVTRGRVSQLHRAALEAMAKSLRASGISSVADLT